FLEHSRIFRSGSEERGYRYYIGSADVMDRNLDRRVEAVVPVTDPALQGRLAEVLETELVGDRLARALDAAGPGTRRPAARGPRPPPPRPALGAGDPQRRGPAAGRARLRRPRPPAAGRGARARPRVRQGRAAGAGGPAVELVPAGAAGGRLGPARGRGGGRR